jgi:sulfur-oxidizing protein SoxY
MVALFLRYRGLADEEQVMRRRIFLQQGMVSAGGLVALQAGLLTPRRVPAAWPDEVYAHRDYAAALRAVTGGTTVLPSAAIDIEVPELIEDGRLVEVTVSSSIEGTEEIIILSEKNPLPLIARFVMGPRSVPTIKTRIKMGGTGNVVALVRGKGAFFSAKKQAQVTEGGCACNTASWIIASGDR